MGRRSNELPASPAGDAPAALDSEQLARIWSAVGRECREAVMVCDTAGQIAFVNRPFELASGYRAVEALGRPLHLLQGAEQHEFYSNLWAVVRSKGHWHGQICLHHKDGTLFQQWLSLAAVEDRSGTVTHYVAVFADVLQHQRAQARIRYLTRIDPLTHLPNRGYLIDRLQGLQAAAANSDSQFALLLIDLDRFKDINDSLGHEAGDEVLKIVGERLRLLLRRSDVVARMGGDEFAVLLTNVLEREDVQSMAARILTEIAKPLVVASREIVISASLGISLFPTDAQGMSEMLRDADTAMYTAKREGGGTWSFYAPVMSRRVRDDFDTETGLRLAIKHHQFELHYQPQLDLRNGRIRSAEALIRWNRPAMGLVMPGSFIALAEERGLIGAIDAWTLHEAMRQLGLWDRAGLPVSHVAVNLSASQFHRSSLLQSVMDVLGSAGLAPQRLEIEVTEGVLLQDCAATLQLMRQLRAFGVELTIDDFGTGYSSLGYLRRLPLDKLKIDRSFITEMLEQPAAEGIVRGIIALAHGLGLRVTAEGVETCAQLNKLRELGCDYAQGFLIGRPVPAAQFARLISQRQLLAERRAAAETPPAQREVCCCE